MARLANHGDKGKDLEYTGWRNPFTDIENATPQQPKMTMPLLRYFVVDAFTDRPFAGNPAAVVPLPEWRDDGWLQNVAMEMNLSETAFLVKQDDGYRLRWFTPKIEVVLCGHATLASAHVLWS